MKTKISGGRLALVILQALIILIIAYVTYKAGKPAYEDYRYAETLEMTVTRREKAKVALDLDPRYLFADDLARPDAFYVKTLERGWLRTDIDTYDHIGRGRAEFDITRRDGEPVIVGIRDVRHQ